MRTKNSTVRSLETITEIGGHLILVKRGLKEPVWSKWQKRKPSLDVVLAHDGRIGLIPNSIGATALDVDHGDPSEPTNTLDQLPDSKAGSGNICITATTNLRGNQNWQAKGCSGKCRMRPKGTLILSIRKAAVSSRNRNSHERSSLAAR